MKKEGFAKLEKIKGLFFKVMLEDVDTVLSIFSTYRVGYALGYTHHFVGDSSWELRPHYTAEFSLPYLTETGVKNTLNDLEGLDIRITSGVNYRYEVETLYKAIHNG